MSASGDICAECGKQAAGFKRCSVCKQASYCGVACQKAAWQSHKKKCSPQPMSVNDVAVKLEAAWEARDWKGMLQLESRMDDLMDSVRTDGDFVQILILSRFSSAHIMAFQARPGKEDEIACARLLERQIPIHGRLQHFSDQGHDMCKIAAILARHGSTPESETWFERARKVGEAHGFFSLESVACIGLGNAMMSTNRHDEGMGMLENALVAADLNELDEPQYELDALKSLLDACFQKLDVWRGSSPRKPYQKECTDKAETLLLRYQKAAKAQSEKEGVCVSEFISLYYSARIHQEHTNHAKAAKDVRALLDLIHENETAVQKYATAHETMLKWASKTLDVLDSGSRLGNTELIKAVASTANKFKNMSSGRT